MNPFRHRFPRTVILALVGFGFTWLVSIFLTPVWPGFCDSTVYGAPCEDVTHRTVWGYTTIALGFGTTIIGPIAGSLIDLWINGANWEQPRGRETVITNVPILVGAIFVAAGVVIIATG